jgi:glycine betaine transporter
MNKNEKNYSLRLGVIGMPLIIFGAIIVFGLVDSKKFLEVLWGFFEWLMVNLGWAIDLGTLGFVIFCMFFLFHPLGKIKFGGKNAKPEFSTWNWWAMSICAGIAIGIVMWPAPEAIQHSVAPARGMNLEPNSHAAIIWAMRTTFLHWTFPPYAIYVAAGIACAYAYYNLKKPYAVSSALCPLLGDKAFGKTATIIDGITLFAITGGVAGSLGYGLLQVGSGLEFVFGIKPGPLVWVIVALIVIASYTTSSATGVRRGIQWLSDKNAWLFFALLAFAIIFGPTSFILNLTTQSVGSFVTHFFEAMTFTDPFPKGDLWPQWWDMYWFVDWLSFAPIIGLFLARLCYGRTIREFVIVNLILPSVFGIIWFGVFGSLAIHVHYVQGFDLASLMNEKGYEFLMLKLFDFLPMAKVIRPIMLITILISFITLADSMTSTVSMMSINKGKDYTSEEAPLKLKVFWGLLMGATALIFLFNGGLEGVKVVKTIAGIPILFIELAMVIGMVRYFSKSKHLKDEMILDDLQPIQTSNVESVKRGLDI